MDRDPKMKFLNLPLLIKPFWLSWSHVVEFFPQGEDIRMMCSIQNLGNRNSPLSTVSSKYWDKLLYKSLEYFRVSSVQLFMSNVAWTQTTTIHFIIKYAQLTTSDCCLNLKFNFGQTLTFKFMFKWFFCLQMFSWEESVWHGWTQNCVMGEVQRHSSAHPWSHQLHWWQEVLCLHGHPLQHLAAQDQECLTEVIKFKLVISWKTWWIIKIQPLSWYFEGKDIIDLAWFPWNWRWIFQIFTLKNWG